MLYSFALFAGLSCSVLSPALGSYDGGYVATHDLDHDDDYFDPSYPAPTIDHHPHIPHGHGQGHSAGSYYHYHVPVLGQQQHHHPPSYHHQDHSHYLWPLLFLLALPLLFLPLLPLLLLPLFISLLALLAPGGMMMMMMMMMPEMMMRRSEPLLSGRALNEMRMFGDVVLTDMSSLLSKYARSLDLDQCPQRVACEMGAMFFFESNSTGPSTAKSLANMMIEQYIPKGKMKRTVKRFEKAFFTGSSKPGSCNAFQCNPSLKIYNNNWGLNGEDSEKRKEPKSAIYRNEAPSSPTVTHFNGSNWVKAPDLKAQQVNFVYPSSGNKDTPVANLQEQDLQPMQSEGKLKAKRSHYNNQFHIPYGKYKVGDIKMPFGSSGGSHDRKTTLYKMFGTPIVKS